jgi:hypothetical protein
VIEHRLSRAEHLPELVAEIRQAVERHARRRQPRDQFVRALHRPRHGLVEAGGIGADLRLVLRVERNPLGHHLGERAAGVMLEMPFLGDHVGKEPVELLRMVDQLFEQRAELPVEQHPANVEHNRFSHQARPQTLAARTPVRRRAAVSISRPCRAPAPNQPWRALKRRSVLLMT